MMFKEEREQYTRAFTAALMADLAADPKLAAEVAEGRIRPDALRRNMLAGALRGVRGERTRFRHVAGLVRSQMNVAERVMLKDSGVGADTAPATAPATSGGSIWSAIGAAVSGAATIASNVLTTKYEAKGTEAVAKLNAQSQQLSLQAQQLAAQTAARVSAASEDDGMPGWVLPVACVGGLLVVGGIAYLATRGSSGRGRSR